MKFNARIKRLERMSREAGVCPLCRGNPGPLVRATFENGDEMVEVGKCSCGGKETLPPARYHLPNRALFDAV